MKPIIPAAGRMALVLCVLAVIGLGIGTVSAAGTAQAGNLTAPYGHAGHHFAANSSHQHTGAGFNLTSGAAGNATHVKRAHGFAPNATTQQERLQVFATALQKKGVDVTALETAIQNNDTAAEKAWFASYMQTHTEQSGNQTHVKKARGFVLNATMQQERLQAFVAALQKQGIDVSALQTAIQSNDTAAEKTWLATYFETHKGQFNNTTRQQWHPWNATASKSA